MESEYLAVGRKHLHVAASLGDRASDSITSFAGSWKFIFLHVVWFVGWIVLSVEAYPYGFLTMAVSLEAIFLSTFVMVSQNRQTSRDRKRDDLESLEVEQILKMQRDLHEVNREQLLILRKLEGLEQRMQPGIVFKEAE